jgi:hypothetical protein
VFSETVYNVGAGYSGVGYLLGSSSNVITKGVCICNTYSTRHVLGCIYTILFIVAWAAYLDGSEGPLAMQTRELDLIGSNRVFGYSPDNISSTRTTRTAKEANCRTQKIEGTEINEFPCWVLRKEASSQGVYRLQLRLVVVQL